MHLIVGLGNPGKEHSKTRHNIGFMLIDKIIEKYDLSSPKLKFHGTISDGFIQRKKVITLKPNTYMNRSGLSVGEVVKFFKIDLDNIIVVHDDIDLNFGKIKIKKGGGSGGHNGLKDIDKAIGKEYNRIRIGVGHPGDKDKVSSYVLNNFSEDENKIISNTLNSISNDIQQMIE